MERLAALAVGIPFAGHAYPTLQAAILRGSRCLHRGALLPCDVERGYRTRARHTLARQWVRGPQGFVRRADPCLPGPYTYYGWQATPVVGGACGGLHYPLGLCGHLGLRVRLRRIRSLLEPDALCLYYKAGVLAPCGALGSRLVPPRLWCPLPPECLLTTRLLSCCHRFWNVELRWQAAEGREA